MSAPEALPQMAPSSPHRFSTGVTIHVPPSLRNHAQRVLSRPSSIEAIVRRLSRCRLACARWVPKPRQGVLPLTEVPTAGKAGNPARAGGRRLMCELWPTGPPSWVTCDSTMPVNPQTLLTAVLQFPTKYDESDGEQVAIMRAMAVFQGHSGLPEDRYVNTFHFSNLSPYASLLTDAFSVLEDLYNNANTTHSLAAWLSPTISRDAEFRFYDLSDDEPRVPTIEPWTLPTAADTDGDPEECAAVLSFHGDPPVTARRRGRIYLGPLAQGAIASADNDTYSALHPQLTADMVLAASSALAVSQGNGAGWSIRSGVPVENFVPIVGGWVDNAIDIQRRRGAEATVRSTWA